MVTGILILLGLAFGSFVNAYVWRLHQQDLPQKKRVATDKELSVVSGRSMCPHCQHTLAWFDLLPVVSWVSVGGRCRYCRKAIGWQYPVVELLTASLFVVSYMAWPFGLLDVTGVALFVAWLISVVLLMSLAVYDLKWMLLPNKVVFPLIGVSLVYASFHIIHSESSILSAVTLQVGSLAIASGLFYVLFQISEGRWIGGGDVKLGIALGLLLGSPLYALMMLFIASVLGILFVVMSSLVKGRGMSRGAVIPFGPCLIAATIAVVLGGQPIWDWYMLSLSLQ